MAGSVEGRCEAAQLDKPPSKLYQSNHLAGKNREAENEINITPQIKTYPQRLGGLGCDHWKRSDK